MAFRWVWQHVSQYKAKMFIGLALVLLVALLNMVGPYVSGIIVDQVIIGKNKSLLFPIITALIAVTITKTIAKYIFQITIERISQNVIFNIREEIYSDLQKKDFGFFDCTRTGDIMARMTGDIDMVRHFVAWVVYMVFENGMVFLFAAAVMFYINFKFALILMLITPVTGYFAYKLAFTVRPTFENIRNQFSKLNSIVQENISGNRIVKAFAKEKYETEKFLEANEDFRKSNIDSSRVWEKYLPIIETTANILPVVMLIVGGIMVIRKSLTLGELVTFNSFIFALNNPMKASGWLINDIERFRASAVKIISLVETKTKISNGEEVSKKDKIKGKVELKNVSFKYGEQWILKDISFKASPGETIGIIGPTGSGKTTLINLICRFYDASEGEVLVDGNNVKLYDIKTLRENVGVAMQDVFLFSDTIEGNISYGVPKITNDQVKWAASLAEAHNFILNLPDGYDTIVGERGVGLSGGQRQRISLARALLRNPSILILDDTTSSLDLETEQKIYKSLKPYYKDKTTFVIAHRIASVKNADRIIVIDEGKIVEQGKHQELLKNKGYYYSVYESQCGKKEDVIGGKGEEIYGKKQI
ncbi:ABC transporter ATP-binding protein/permease [Clostridium swellfunianum]|uniref:ABC transporter ATP-binding protein n=1 Tax=Clostridium swellfunianum TaxID=1367462 RepID=UPI0020303B6A|nr:ABC transporter ATP-binding protein [Clostridium swellfunianum]MCM0649547.1 ABC transporter ATP-binding protein/permease [Clostridium swellfunianum]